MNDPLVLEGSELKGTKMQEQKSDWSLLSDNLAECGEVPTEGFEPEGSGWGKGGKRAPEPKRAS